MGADFDRAYFSQVRIPKGNFIAANLNSVEIYGGSFEGADFQGADMRNVRTFRGTQGAGTAYNDNEPYAGYVDYAYPADFGPIFSSASTDYVNSQEGYDPEAIRLVDFRGARFLKTDIRGADLSNSTISQTQVDEACADQTTKLPSGFRCAQIACRSPG